MDFLPTASGELKEYIQNPDCKVPTLNSLNTFLKKDILQNQLDRWLWGGRKEAYTVFVCVQLCIYSSLLKTQEKCCVFLKVPLPSSQITKTRSEVYQEERKRWRVYHQAKHNSTQRLAEATPNESLSHLKLLKVRGFLKVSGNSSLDQVSFLG